MNCLKRFAARVILVLAGLLLLWLLEDQLGSWAAVIGDAFGIFFAIATVTLFYVAVSWALDNAFKKDSK